MPQDDADIVAQLMDCPAWPGKGRLDDALSRTICSRALSIYWDACAEYLQLTRTVARDIKVSAVCCRCVRRRSVSLGVCNVCVCVTAACRRLVRCHRSSTRWRRLYRRPTRR